MANGNRNREDVKMEKIRAISAAFSPSAPIDQRDLFAGRIEQIQDVMVSLGQKGQHIILYGERGVGKTSLANVLHQILQRPKSADLRCTTINCDEQDTFSSIWHKVFRELHVPVQKTAPGFSSDVTTHNVPAVGMLPPKVAPDDIRYALNALPQPVMIILDEFDTVKDKEVTTLIAHTIKNLSDHRVSSKLIIVGVADSVEELIAEHQSVERSLVQIRMPRMSRAELFEILEKGLARAKMTIGETPKNVIAQLSQGLPHYTHLLGLHSAIEAINMDRDVIEIQDVYAATSRAVEKSPNHSTHSAFSKATSSARPKNLHSKVLLACSLVEKDSLGEFSGPDIRMPLRDIAEKSYEIASFQKHLDDFCDEKRGPLLKKLGPVRRYRYRFLNPMMPPFVIIQGIRKGLLGGDALEKYVHGQYKKEESSQSA